MTPNTTITLYATDFDISNRYVVKADSVGEALAAVSAFPSRVYTNCYWQRTNDFMVRATGNINEVQKYNYCVYVNNGQYNFAFITRYQYVNDDMTWIYLALDPWLNFAGKYVFHDSPMRRCHPVADDPANPNYIQEPVNVRGFDIVKRGFGTPSQEGLFKVYLMTTVKTTSFTDQSIADYWDGIAALLESYDSQKLIAYSQDIDSGMTFVVGGNVQPNTSVLTLSEAKQVIKRFSQNGQSNYLLGAYHIPDYFRDVGADDGPDLTALNPVNKDVQVDSGKNIGTIHWKKILYAPQFRKFILSVTGNTREIPADKMVAANLAEGLPLTLSITTNPGVGGSALVVVNGMPEKELYGVESLSWDSVSLTGFGVSANPVKRNLLAKADSTFNGLMGMLNAFNPFGGFGEAISAIEQTAVDYTEQSLEMEQIVKSGGVSIGTTTQTLSTYNLALPLITYVATQPDPEETERLETIFGTYGYMQDGNALPIVFGNYPFWNYYQTVDASITGKEVPQEYLYQVIRMFNRGVFVFNDIASYKDFSKASENHL